MVRGLYTAGVGMTAAMNKVDVIANNIANAATTGYKKDNVITQSFSEELMKRLHDPALNHVVHDVGIGGVRLGVFVDTIHTDFMNGSLNITGNEFDLAVVGDGFFVVTAEDRTGTQGEHYTRNGSFALLNGMLITKDGYAVMGSNGVINIPDGDFSVSETGAIYIDGEFIDNIRMVSFNDNQSLRKYKDNLYTTTPESQIVEFAGSIQQGALEMSNVNTVREMVDLITTHRNYEASQRVITTIDQQLGRAVSDIARR